MEGEWQGQGGRCLRINPANWLSLDIVQNETDCRRVVVFYTSRLLAHQKQEGAPQAHISGTQKRKHNNKTQHYKRWLSHSNPIAGESKCITKCFGHSVGITNTLCQIRLVAPASRVCPRPQTPEKSKHLRRSYGNCIRTQ